MLSCVVRGQEVVILFVPGDVNFILVIGLVKSIAAFAGCE
jgi:hypothetical protein